MDKSWKAYDTGSFFDELITPARKPRVAARRAVNLLQALPSEEMAARRAAAELAIKEMGVSFTIYSEGKNIDRAWPFDIIPRIIAGRDWDRVSRGLAQRTRALNCFIDDVYNRQRILKDGVVPADLAEPSPSLIGQPASRNSDSPSSAWTCVPTRSRTSSAA